VKDELIECYWGVPALVAQLKAVMQFKVTLLDVEPPVWRRIQVTASYSFWDLHVAIQDAMGWQDYHLHVFEVQDADTGEVQRFGIPSGEDGDKTLPSWEHDVADCLCEAGAGAVYEYDFGDCWRHSVVLEMVVSEETDKVYPVCLDGARKCPPEDSGGVSGYARFLEAIADPDDEEHEAMLEWAGGAFDPEEFDAAAVRFDDPEARWQYAFGGGL
jgi:hypothetical protein